MTSCYKPDVNNNNILNGNRQQEPIQVIQRILLSSAPNQTNPQKLPHYPLPQLEDTLQKFLKSVKPLLNNEKYHQTENLIEKFGKGIGAKLHTLLKKKAEQSENWLADWWTTVAYLSWRVPVVINCSPGLYFPTRFFENEFQWCHYASQIIWASLRYKQMVDNNEISLEKAGKFPLDMAQYKKIFGTSRVPAPGVDKISFNPQSRHIVVAYRNGVSSFIDYFSFSEIYIFCSILFNSIIMYRFTKILRTNFLLKVN